MTKRSLLTDWDSGLGFLSYWFFSFKARPTISGKNWVFVVVVLTSTSAARAVGVAVMGLSCSAKGRCAPKGCAPDRFATTPPRVGETAIAA